MSEDLREQLTAALESSEEIQEPVEAIEPADSGRERDEFGRFKAREGEAQEAQAQDPEPWKAPPKSWRKELHDKYGTLDPDVARYIHEREQQFTKGVTDYKSRADQLEAEVAPLKEVQTEFNERLGQLGGASQAFRQFLEVDRMLLNGSPEQKASVIAAMAQACGVPLDGTMQIPIQDQTIYPLQQRLQALEQQLEAQAINSAQSRVDAFAATVPYWDGQIEGDMAFLIQSGRVSKDDLQSAYDMATRINPEVFEQVNAAKAQKEQARKVAAIAKASAVSPRSSTPTATSPVATGDLRSQLEASFSALGGRI